MQKNWRYWTPRFIEKLQAIPEIRDVASDQQNQGLLATLTIDRDTASRLGVLPADIDNTLYDAFGQRQVSTIFTQLNQYHVVMEVDPQFQQDPDALKNIYVHSSTGPQVPLSAFTRMEPGSTPLTLNHQGQFPVVTLSFQLAPNAAPWRRRQRHQQDQAGLNMPASVQGLFQGTAAAFQNSLANEPILILRRAHHRVHRAWGFVRKLYSSHHDSFHAAFRGRRRHPRADAVPHGIQRHRA